MASVAIVGVGESEWGRSVDRPLDELILDSCRLAIADAGLQGHDIDGFVPCTPHPAADELAASLGAKRSFTVKPGLEAGAGTVGAALLAEMMIEKGLAKNVLVYFGYKGSKPGGPYSYHAEDPVKAAFEMPFGWYGQPVYFAMWAQRYCHDYNVDPATFADIALSARAWAQLTPGAQKAKPLTRDGYFEAPMVATPMRTLDCCLISDGGAAYVISSVEQARDLAKAPVLVGGVGVGSTEMTMGSIFSQNRPDPLRFGALESSAMAYAKAGISAKDVDFAQIYDCFSISMVLQLEEMGFAERGAGAAFCSLDRIGPGGSFPINTNGGHLCYSYLPGMNHVVEAVRQVRGERGDAQVSRKSVCAIGGLGGNDHATLVLTEDR